MEEKCWLFLEKSKLMSSNIWLIIYESWFMSHKWWRKLIPIKQLAECKGCDPEIPVANDANVVFTCALNTKNIRKCTARCADGSTILGKFKYAVRCRCPRTVSLKQIESMKTRSINFFSAPRRSHVWMVQRSSESDHGRPRVAKSIWG